MHQVLVTQISGIHSFTRDQSGSSDLLSLIDIYASKATNQHTVAPSRLVNGN